MKQKKKCEGKEMGLGYIYAAHDTLKDPILKKKKSYYDMKTLK